MTAGFPNLFMITGPGSPSVLSNMIVSIEQHVEWISDCLAAVAARQGDCIEASGEAERDWVRHVAEAADRTLFPLANSWYMGANIPGKPRVILPYVAGVGAYRKICEEIVADGYRGFAITGAAEARAAAE
jgi:cyclohexanone monooxygenase